MATNWQTLTAAVRAGANLHAVGLLRLIRSGEFTQESALRLYLGNGWDFELPESRITGDAVQIERLSREFSRLVMRQLSFEDRQQLANREGTTNDYCNANLCLNEAFINIFQVAYEDVFFDPLCTAIANAAIESAAQEHYHYNAVMETECGRLIYAFDKQDAARIKSEYTGFMVVDHGS